MFLYLFIFILFFQPTIWTRGCFAYRVYNCLLLWAKGDMDITLLWLLAGTHSVHSHQFIASWILKNKDYLRAIDFMHRVHVYPLPQNCILLINELPSFLQYAWIIFYHSLSVAGIVTHILQVENWRPYKPLLSNTLLIVNAFESSIYRYKVLFKRCW